jgi:hypothetical protein
MVVLTPAVWPLTATPSAFCCRRTPQSRLALTLGARSQKALHPGRGGSLRNPRALRQRLSQAAAAWLTHADITCRQNTILSKPATVAASRAGDLRKIEPGNVLLSTLPAVSTSFPPHLRVHVVAPDPLDKNQRGDLRIEPPVQKYLITSGPAGVRNPRVKSSVN